MDTQSLQAFIAVAEAGSFSQAAEQLFLTQPAISKRISNLEDQLNTPLFDRVGRSIRLTEAGQLLLPQAKHILQSITAAERSLHNLSGDVNGVLHIGTSHHIGLHRLPPILKAYSERYPDVELDIQFLDSEKACEAVMQAELELGVVTLPPHTDDRLECRNIWNDPLCFVCAPDHPLKQSTCDVSLERIVSYDAILPGTDTFTRRIVSELIQEQALSMNVMMSTNYLETIKVMVSIGLGWSVLPRSMVDCSISELHITDLQKNKTELYRQLGYVLNPKLTLSNAARAMIELIQTTAQ